MSFKNFVINILFLVLGLILGLGAFWVYNTHKMTEEIHAVLFNDVEEIEILIGE